MRFLDGCERELSDSSENDEGQNSWTIESNLPTDAWGDCFKPQDDIYKQ